MDLCKECRDDRRNQPWNTPEMSVEGLCTLSFLVARSVVKELQEELAHLPEDAAGEFKRFRARVLRMLEIEHVLDANAGLGTQEVRRMDRDRKRKAYLKAIAGGVIRPDVYEMMKAQNQTQGDPEKRRVRKRQYDRNSKKRMKKLVKVMKVWSQILVWWVQYRNRYPEGIYSTWQEEEGDPAKPLPHGWVPDKNTLDAVLAEENPDDADNSLTWAEIGEKRPAIFTAQPGRYGQSPTLLTRKEMCIRVYHAVSADLYEWMESSPPGYEVHGCYNPAGRWNRPCLRHQGHGGGCQHHPGIFPKEGRDSIDGHLVTRDDLDEFLKMADSKRFSRGFRSKREEIYDWFKKRYKDYDQPFVPFVGLWSKIALALLGLFILAPGEDEEEGEQPEESDYNDDEGDWEKQFGDDEDDDDELSLIHI